LTKEITPQKREKKGKTRTKGKTPPKKIKKKRRPLAGYRERVPRRKLLTLKKSLKKRGETPWGRP